LAGSLQTLQVLQAMLFSGFAVAAIAYFLNQLFEFEANQPGIGRTLGNIELPGGQLDGFFSQKACRKCLVKLPLASRKLRRFIGSTIGIPVFRAVRIRKCSIYDSSLLRFNSESACCSF
jgi:hypothetical protein